MGKIICSELDSCPVVIECQGGGLFATYFFLDLQKILNFRSLPLDMLLSSFIINISAFYQENQIEYFSFKIVSELCLK